MNNILGQHDPLSVWHCNKWSIDYLQPNRSPWRAPKRGFEWYSGVKCGWWMLIGQLFLSVWQPNTKLIFWLFGPKMYLYGFVKKGGTNDIPWMFWGKWKQVWFQVQTSVVSSANKCGCWSVSWADPAAPPSLSGNPTPNRCSMSRTPCSFEYSPVL